MSHPIAGPSTRRQAQPHSPNLLGSSPEFGDFESAPLTNDDLLGSFDDVSPQATRVNKPKRPSVSNAFPNLLDHTSWSQSSSRHNLPPRPPDPNQPLIQFSLPPRPDEIGDDYVPPPTFRTPRRLSQVFSAGPSSPPQLSDFGKEILFHPNEPGSPENRPKLGHSTSGPSSPLSSAHSKLFTALTTSKIASKWRAAVDTHTFDPPSRQNSNDHRPASRTALPIDVSHSTPFASLEQLSGSYIPPSGAPGFHASDTSLPRTRDVDHEYGGTRLLGRHASTAGVLDESLADQIRARLPTRQRLADKWNLVFSMDQHGASLATLYRSVERYVDARGPSANLLVIRDGRNHIFGAYITEPIRKREGSYYGGGESFLYKSPHPRGVDGVRFFPWTGRNQYFALCEHDSISFGGGSGTYGLFLDSTFTRNSTGTSLTYDNECLNTAEDARQDRASHFDCIGVEVWAI